MKLARLMLVLATVAFVTSAADASIMTYTGLGLSESAKLHAPGYAAHNVTTQAGEINIYFEGASYTAYCVDLDEAVGSGVVQIRSYSTLANHEMVAYLLDTFAGDVSTDRQAAALQVAIWELIAEESNQWDAGLGGFKVKGNAALVDAANALLDGLPSSYTPAAEPMVLYSYGRQNVIVTGATSVPEPAAMTLLSLGAVATWMRRRKR